jgi:hypothetical protein
MEPHGKSADADGNAIEDPGNITDIKELQELAHRLVIVRLLS